MRRSAKKLEEDEKNISLMWKIFFFLWSKLSRLTKLHDWSHPNDLCRWVTPVYRKTNQPVLWRSPVCIVYIIYYCFILYVYRVYMQCHLVSFDSHALVLLLPMSLCGLVIGVMRWKAPINFHFVRGLFLFFHFISIIFFCFGNFYEILLGIS